MWVVGVIASLHFAKSPSADARPLVFLLSSCCLVCNLMLPDPWNLHTYLKTHTTVTAVLDLDLNIGLKE